MDTVWDEAQDPLGPTWQQRRGGEKVPYSVAFTLLAFVGATASAMLVRSGYIVHTDPGAQLVCDVNPLIGCSSSLTSAQGALFGVPNALIGLVGFAGLIGVGLALLARRQLPRWLWWALAAGTLAGLAWIVWFLYLSVALFRTLCPYCLVVWTVTIPLACLVWTHLVRTCRPDEPLGGVRRVLVQARWFIVVLAYVGILAAIGIGLSDKVAMVL